MKKSRFTEAQIIGVLREQEFWTPPARQGAPVPEPPQDAVQHPPVIDPRHPAGLVRQKRLDDRPFLVAQFVSAA